MVKPKEIKVLWRKNMRKTLLAIMILFTLTLVGVSTTIGNDMPDNDTRQGPDGTLDYYYDNGLGRNVYFTFSQNRDLKNWRLSDQRPPTAGANNMNAANLNSSFNSRMSALVFNFPYDTYPLAGLTANYEAGITPYVNLTINTNYVNGKVVNFEIRFDKNGDGTFETNAMFNPYTTQWDQTQHDGNMMEEYIKQQFTGYSNGPPGNMNNGMIQLAFWRTDGITDNPGTATDESWLTIYCGAYLKRSWVALPFKWADLDPVAVIKPDEIEDPTDWWLDTPDDPYSPHFYGYVANHTIVIDGSQSSSPIGLNLTYYWQFGDAWDDDRNKAVVEHEYKYPGVYQIELWVTDSNSRTGWSNKWINISRDPGIIPEIDTFLIEPNPALVGAEVEFTVHATDPDGHATLDLNVLYYRWDFDGDGDWDTNLTEYGTALYVYEEPGTYTVRVGASDGPLNHTDTLTQIEEKSLIVKINEGPVVNFTVSTAFKTVNYPGDDSIMVIVGEEVTLDFTACSDPDNLPGFGIDPHNSIQLKVDFKDGLGALVRYDDDVMYKYNYTKAGPYNRYSIAIMVSDGNIEEEITFYVIIDVPPKADAGLDQGTEEPGPDDIPTGEIVFFNGSGSFDPNDDTNGNEIIDGTEADNCTYQWDFGDGIVSPVLTTPLVNHTYTENGTYIVTLTVTDTRGQTSRDTLTVIVLPPNALPVAVIEIEGGETTFDTNREIFFRGESSFDEDNETGGNIIKYYWDFGDNTTSDEKNPSHVYSDGDQYVVTLVVEDERGGKSEPIAKILRINNQKPEANIRKITDADGNEIEFNKGDPYSFISESIDVDGTIVEYKWEIDGVVIADWSSTSEITHTFEKYGIHTIKLMVKDDDGAYNKESDISSVYTIDIPEPEIEKEPGFELTFAILAIALIGLVAMKKRSR